MILFLDGSFTPTCDSNRCLESIKECVQKEDIISLTIKEQMEWNQVYRYLEDAGAIVLDADVHMNSVSACVLSFLERIEHAVIGGESIGGKFYAVLYTELYEGEQTSIAMEILKNFCTHANIMWGRGLGIGGNGMKPTVHRRNLWQWFRKDTSDFREKPLQEQAFFIKEKMQGTDQYINPQKFSRKKYMRKINHDSKKNSLKKIAKSL